MSLSVEDFSKFYENQLAVDRLTFDVPPGTILGLVGPNGAGKTTTMRALAGIIKPTQGRLAIAGHDLAREPVQAKTALAYIPDEPKLFDQLTIWEHLQFTAAAYRLTQWEPKAEDLLSTFDLTDKRNSLCGELSRGMRQKVAICCGYLHEPKAIMMDEPLTGLDPYGIRAIKESIRQRAAQGAAILISSHLLALVEDLCTAVLILHQGRQILHADIETLRRRGAEDGRTESLEEMFFRLTSTPVRPQRSMELNQ
jgi:ABC-2 type transport system ATP-binding protein